MQMTGKGLEMASLSHNDYGDDDDGDDDDDDDDDDEWLLNPRSDQ